MRNALALFAGIVAGSLINMALVMLGPLVIPLPPGVDMSNAESIGAAMHLFEPKHFVFPFLAHAAGTFAGALVAYRLAVSYRMGFAMAIGVVFLAGGIAASVLIPAPVWFIALDLLLAYIPMAWLGYRLAMRLNGRSNL